nr:histidine kinase [Millionella massiliensis]
MAQTLRLSQRAAELQAENNAARYAALQSQLNPHFLFNNLNALIAEIEYDPARAVSFTCNLSEVYRYVLQAQSRPLVSLGEELRFAEAYLYLHVVRLATVSVAGSR